MIKANSIRYESDSKITIDYKARDEELQTKRNSKVLQPQTSEEFTEGLQAVVVDSIVSEEDQRKKAEMIVENAKAEATKILEAAKDKTLQLKETAINSGIQQGYEEGIRKANLEIELIKKKLLDQEMHQKKEYQDLLAGIEGQVAEMIASLITRLTGILVEDKEDIILYLVEKTFGDVDGIEDCTIRVSKEDYDILLSKKDYIKEKTGNNIQITIDPLLAKNQCMIETESKIIDCSLDVQMNNLITDLKLLSAI